MTDASRQRERTVDAPEDARPPRSLRCIQCHTLMDPIGFALENFDAIATWRTEDDGKCDRSRRNCCMTARRSTGRPACAKWLAGYSDQFVQVAIEKLLTYALGRGVDYQDMPLIRSIARRRGPAMVIDFSALVLGIVKSKPFLMNMKMQRRFQLT